MDEENNLKLATGLTAEWALLFHSFNLADEDSKQKIIDRLRNQIKEQKITGAEIQERTSFLSRRRKQLNLKIERLKEKIDELQITLENLQLVGSNTEDIQNKILKLSEDGQTYSEEIFKIETEVKKWRELESLLNT